MKTRFIDENMYAVICPKDHRHPYHLAGYIVIDERIAYWKERGEDVELSIKDMSEIVRIMKKLEKHAKSN